MKDQLQQEFIFLLSEPLFSRLVIRASTTPFKIMWVAWWICSKNQTFIIICIWILNVIFLFILKGWLYGGWSCINSNSLYYFLLVILLIYEFDSIVWINMFNIQNHICHKKNTSKFLQLNVFLLFRRLWYGSFCPDRLRCQSRTTVAGVISGVLGLRGWGCDAHCTILKPLML